jgi:hypothetical protein
MSPLDSRPPMTAHLDGEIRNGRHHMQVRVYYEDTDFSVLTVSLQEIPSESRISAVDRCVGKRSTPMMAASLP